jgi:hypothetical protein
MLRPCLRGTPPLGRTRVLCPGRIGVRSTKRSEGAARGPNETPSPEPNGTPCRCHDRPRPPNRKEMPPSGPSGTRCHDRSHPVNRPSPFIQRHPLEQAPRARAPRLILVRAYTARASGVATPVSTMEARSESSLGEGPGCSVSRIRPIHRQSMYRQARRTVIRRSIPHRPTKRHLTPHRLRERHLTPHRPRERHLTQHHPREHHLTPHRPHMWRLPQGRPHKRPRRTSRQVARR